MLRIQRASNGKVVFTLSGRIEAEDVAELRRLLALEAPAAQILLDLGEVLLVERAGVEFLAECEAAGITLDCCPAYVRMWIDQIKGKI